MAMAILVIEEGAPNGVDLVLRGPVNGVSKAQEPIKVVDLGDDFALAGVRLDVAWDETRENLCVVLMVDAGRNSRLVGLQIVPTLIAEVGRVNIASLKEGIAEALSPKATEQLA